MGRIWKLTTPLRLTSATPQMATSEPATSRAESDLSPEMSRARTAVTIGPKETRIATLLALV